MTAMQQTFFDWAKQQGPIFVIMAIVVYVLFDKLGQTEDRYERKIERIEQQVQDCNKASIQLLKDQIEKNNMMLERFADDNIRNR